MEITRDLIAERKQWMLNKQFSKNTIQNYETDLNLFIKWIRLKTWGITVWTEEISLLEVEHWKTYLSNVKTPKNSIYYTVRPTLSQQTIQSKLTAVKSFLKYINLFYQTWLSYRDIEIKRVKTNYIECLNDSEFLILKNYIKDYEKYRINALRMLLLCNIWYTSWLRLSEMLNLTIPEVQKREARIIWKGNKARWVFFTSSTEELLEEYIEEREKPIPRTNKIEKKSDFIFISHNSWYDFWNPISKETICWIMKKYSDWMNIWKRVTVHMLRHSYATKLLESWMNIREIQELLWHSDLKTTQWYCHVLQSNLKNKVSQIFE